MKRALLIVAIVLAISSARAQIVDPRNVMITNVYVLEGSEEREAVLVNILIRDNTCLLYTSDAADDWLGGVFSWWAGGG